MADPKMDIEAVAARKWVGEVQHEVAKVNETLKKVRETCNSFPGSDDVIVKSIVKTGTVLENTWNAATDAYKNAWEKISDGIDSLVVAGQEVLDSIENFITKHGK